MTKLAIYTGVFCQVVYTMLGQTIFAGSESLTYQIFHMPLAISFQSDVSLFISTC